MEGFGKYLKNKREMRGMTVNQLGMYSDISAATISRIENNKRGVPKPGTIKKLSAALKVPYEEMMKEAGHMDALLNEDKFIEDIDVFDLSDAEIINKYHFIIDDIPIDEDQIKLFVNLVRAGRMK